MLPNLNIFNHFLTVMLFLIFSFILIFVIIFLLRFCQKNTELDILVYLKYCFRISTSAIIFFCFTVFIGFDLERNKYPNLDEIEKIEASLFKKYVTEVSKITHPLEVYSTIDPDNVGHNYV